MANRSLVFDILARVRGEQDVEKLGQAAERTHRRFGMLSASAGGVRAAVGTGFGLAAGVVGFDKLAESVKGFYDEGREAQKVGAQTNAVIKSTGGAARVTADQVGNLATAISNKVGVDDEAIQSGANLLLTFTGVRNEAGKGNKIFDQATSVITDMTAAMNGGVVTNEGLKSSAIQVGKALNDPIKGITALTRVGVTFTQKQKDQITSLVNHGHALDAQKIILGELNKEFGGSAAAGTTAMQKLGVVFGNIKERIGTALLPYIDRFASWLSKVLPAAVDRGAAVIGKIVTGVQALGAAFRGEGVTSDGFVGFMEQVGVAARSVSEWLSVHVVPAVKSFGVWVTSTAVPAATRFAQAAGPVLVKVLQAVTGFITGRVVPAVKALAAWITGTVVPAAQRLWAFLAKNLGPTFSALTQTLQRNVLPALQGLWVRFRQVLPTILQVAGFVAKFAGVLIALAVVILGKVLPPLIRLSGPVFGGLIAILGKVIGIAAALARAFIGATTTVIRVVLPMVGAIVTGAAKALGWVPGIGGKLKAAAAAFGKFRDDVNGALSGVRSRTVSVTATLGTVSKNTSYAAAKGWRIPGYGGGDTVPIMAERGEAIIPKHHVPEIASWARSKGIPGFAAGGVVGGLNVRPELLGYTGFRAALAGFSDSLNTAARKLVPAFTGNASVASVAAATAQLLGRPGESAAWARRIMFESGGNWNAVNRSDSNWLAGHPSVGGAQVIAGTFAANAGRYRSTGPFLYGVSVNPLANSYAGGHYAIGRYGSLAAVDPLVRPRGYRSGLAYVPQDDWPATLHRGERVLTAQQNAAYSGAAPAVVQLVVDGRVLAEAMLREERRGGPIKVSRT